MRMRLIEAESLKELFPDNGEGSWTYNATVKAYIDAQPTVQSEHKTGHWIPVTNGRGGHQCDRCGCYAPSYQSGTEWLSNFCPECNADMRGEQK